MKIKISLLIGLLLSCYCSFFSQSKEKIEMLYCKSDLVILASIKDVEFSPNGVWSGGIVSTRTVKYKIEEIYKGNFEGSEINIEHPIYFGTKIADTKYPRLSPKLFKKGSKVIVFVELLVNDDKNIYSIFNTDFGVIRKNALVIKELKRQKILSK